MSTDILLAFIPIFVAVDAIGLLPVFGSLTQGLRKKERSEIITQSIFTAAGVAVGFVFLGKAIFKFLGITIGDFMVAGGAILFCIAIVDLMTIEKPHRIHETTLGVVPLGTPLIAGPAVLTTSLIIIDHYGIVATLISILGNILLVGIIFTYSDRLLKILGATGSRAISKVTSLFLAAIAIMMIRKGIAQILNL